MINSLNLMQQIESDQMAIERISESLAKLSRICQQYGAFSVSSDNLITTERLTDEMSEMNEEINRDIVAIYTRRQALKDGIISVREFDENH